MNLQLSDGTTLQVPDDATPDAIRNYAARGEQYIRTNRAPAPSSSSPYAMPDDPDPMSANNTARRWVRNVVTGIPDLVVGAHNAGLLSPLQSTADYITGTERPVSKLPMPSELYNKYIGDVPNLPEDTSYGRHIGEGVLAAAPFGARGVADAARAAPSLGRSVLDAAGSFGRNVVGSTVGSDVGGRVGGAIAGEKGQILGSLAGGAAPSVSPSSIIQSRYAGRGKQNAPEIAAAAERLGIEPTAGALGNLDIQARENRYAGNYPQGLASREQQRIRAEMAGAGEDIGVQRGGTGGSVAQVGDDIRSATTDRLQADRDYSSAGQENLQRDVGDLTPVPIYNIIQQARAAYPGLTVPGRNALTHRIVEQLYPLITQRDAHGNPVIGPNSTVPYGLLKQWRTELGQSFDQGRIPRNRELYGPATDAMADAASSTGIPRGEFNRVQEFTRGVEGEGGLADRLAPYDKEPQAAYNYTLEGGLNNPDRVQTFARETAGDPRQDRVFGNYLQQLAADTLGTGGAQGPRKFADIIQNADPRAIATIADQVAPAVRDLATVAQGVNVPTSQTGLTRATGGVANTLGGKFLGSEVLGQLAGAIDPILAMPARGIGYLARPSLDWINQRIMQSDAAKRGMIGAPNPRRPMSIDELVRILNIVGQQQGQQQPAP